MRSECTFSITLRDERWQTLKPKLEKINDCPVGQFEINPYEYTAKFCTDYNIYCPNKEIRDYMEKKRNNNSTIIQQRGEENHSLASSNSNIEYQSLASSNTNIEDQSLTSSNTNIDDQSFHDIIEAKNKEINMLREENEKLKCLLNEIKEKLKLSLNELQQYIAVIEQLNNK